MKGFSPIAGVSSPRAASGGDGVVSALSVTDDAGVKTISLTRSGLATLSTTFTAHSATALSVDGTATKTLYLTQSDGTVISTSWTDLNTGGGGGGSGAGIFTEIDGTNSYTTSSITVGATSTPSALVHISSSGDEGLLQVDGKANGTVLYATGSGRVGIGTDSPDYTLDVAGNIGVDQKIYHNDDANTYINFTDDMIQLEAF